jgi:antirestriction protein
MKNEHHSQPHHELESHELHPCIWIGSLADYNAGRLHGEWLDAAVDAIDLQAAIKRILASSREPSAEEWGIFDYDDFGAFHVDEHEALDQVAVVARGIVEFGPAFAAWAEIHEGNPDMLAQFEDCFMGTYESPADWAREVLESSDIEVTLDREIPADLRAYIQFDYDGLAYDARLGGDIHIEDAPEGKVWIFRVI